MVLAIWHTYQVDAAEVFSELGCSAIVDASLQGARASHKVDVAVQFASWGIPQIWVVECKYQRRRVTKSAVETLKSIMQDIGAEKAFLLTEAGFQPGAVAAAEKTNISMSSLAELKACVAPDLTKRLLTLLETEVLNLTKLVRSLQVKTRCGHGTTISGKPGVNFSQAMSGFGCLTILSFALQAAKIGEFGYVVPQAFPKKLKMSVRLPDEKDLLLEGTRLVAEIKVWYLEQERRIAVAAKRISKRNSSRAS